MKFLDVAKLFEKLEKTPKRLEKVLLLRDFYENNPGQLALLFDNIAGNYQRDIGKKSLGISTKTLLDVIGFVTKKKQSELQKEFNKKGDIGIVAEEAIVSEKQNSLNSQTLKFDDIMKSLSTISKKTGSKSNSFKKEILSKLFIQAKEPLEYRYLARFLVDDLRIGVSQGTLKDTITFSFFPYVISVHNVCNSCFYVNSSNEVCFNCNKKIDLKNQEDIVLEKFSVHNCKTPENTTSLDSFISTRTKKEELRYILRTTKAHEFIITDNPRDLFNLFQKTVEKQYNCLNSFDKLIKKCVPDLEECVNVEVEIHQPILSMLGTRAKDLDDAISTTGFPALLDYKYDGMRVQIHNERGKVILFSRNLDIVTKQFPEIVKFIKNNFSDCSFVIDSECVGYDVGKKEFLPFQILSRRILTKDVSSVKSIEVVVKAFDIMYYNGKTILDESYEKRREILENLFIGRTIIQDEFLIDSK